MPTMTPGEKKKGWWIETRTTIPCILPPDGLLVVFDMKDAEEALDAFYPYTTRDGQKVWYFNSTRDRECAEQDGERVYVNPSVMYELFFEPNKED